MFIFILSKKPCHNFEHQRKDCLEICDKLFEQCGHHCKKLCRNCEKDCGDCNEKVKFLLNLFTLRKK